MQLAQLSPTTVVSPILEDAIPLKRPGTSIEGRIRSQTLNLAELHARRETLLGLEDGDFFAGLLVGIQSLVGCSH
jgi:hypothetical protein